jgi:thiosulfate dehydrogenase [quinone] large subunit
LALLAAVLVFTLGTYDYYRGSVVTAYHGGPVSPTIFHVTLSDAVLTPQALRFHAYLDAGSGDNHAHILEASLLGADGSVLEHWDMQALSHLPAEALHNTYPYNKFTTGPYGLAVGMGAKAVIELPISHAIPTQAGMILRVTTVDGDSFSTTVKPAG